MKVAVIGTGYVGLVAGTCLADTGHEVICVDIDPARIEALEKGIIPIYEPGLDTLVHRNVEAGRLTFSMDTVAAVKESVAVFLAVPTPMGDDGSANLEYIFAAARQVAQGINGYKVIVDKSTVPVGTADRVRAEIAALTNEPFDVISVPEFLKEGNAIEDFMKPDRVVIGCESARAEEIMRDLYSPFVRSGSPMIVMRVRSAELTKYTANSLLAAKIAYINEIAQLCEIVGADINEVRAGIGSDKRIGSSFLHPGLGFGGSCFPKDLNALNHTSMEYGLDLYVVQATIRSNDRQKQLIPGKIVQHFGENLTGLTIAVWGLAFKANTDDIRESPALKVLDLLIARGATVKAYDPQAMSNTAEIYGDKVQMVKDTYSAVEGADALVVATEWNEFRRPDFERIKKLMRQHIVFDGRNLFAPDRMRNAGFTYYSVGQA